MADDTTTLSVLAVAAFLPALIFLLWVRAHERHEREPLRAVLVTFLYGASIGVGIAVLLHVLFEFGFHHSDTPIPVAGPIVGAVIIAPIVEELAKALGLGLARNEMDELEDGIIYGAAIGLGFAATENFVYGITALVEGGFGVALTTIVTRVFSSMLLHASATAIVGFGYGVAVRRGGVSIEVLPHLLIAMLLHAGYNSLVSFDSWFGFFAAVLLVIFVSTAIRRRIRELDALPHQAG